MQATPNDFDDTVANAIGRITALDVGDALALAAALTAGVALYFGLVSARDWIIRGLRRTQDGRGRWRAMLSAVVASTWRISLCAIALAASAIILGAPGRWVGPVLSVVLILQAGLWSMAGIGASLERVAQSSTADRSALAGALSLVRNLANVAVWSVVAMVLLANLGIDITALLAGLGIGGIAIGLAAQGIFADLFASLSIVIDRPFVRGDFVVFDDVMGTIERIGIKSTRIRSLSGEEIVISNAKLLTATIRNYQLLRQRRITFAVAVVYRTTFEQAKLVPELIKRAVEAQPKARFDRAHFKTFGDSALEFEVVYFVLDADYNVYMDVQQAINLELMSAFARHGIEFAYPTRTVIVEGAEKAVTIDHRRRIQAAAEA